jgi:hypothetical protein
MHRFRIRPGCTYPRAAVSWGLAVTLGLVVALPALATCTTAPAVAAVSSGTTSAHVIVSVTQASTHAMPIAALVTPAAATVTASTEETGSLESAASKASETGRKVAMSLIALGFAIASIVLAFKRDFKEAAGIFAVGLVSILLATPAGVNVLHDTVNTLFGSS